MNSKNLSITCLVISVLIWIPNLFFQVASPLWLFTFLIGPLGAGLAFLGKKKGLLIANVVMTFSFFIVMAVGYIAEATIL